MVINGNNNRKVNHLNVEKNVDSHNEYGDEDKDGIDDLQRELSREWDDLINEYFDESTNQLHRQIEQELDDALQQELDKQIEYQMDKTFKKYWEESIEVEDNIHLEMEKILHLHDSPPNLENRRVTVADIDATIQRAIQRHERR
mmetsp:Transcript_20038/g.30372  ORF Transcript_20038/g.30372 Transcript_20038/m.30372 type:complete len:144 (-) Transcript_20038:115-546(-)|eukprot:CAMPEP_0194252074 /NCGR_PEP_ID=MMETSP0158-20130606/26728_1 /TAXON_ID=33649 /ORGANISM="Thalassionema nitzschioides, Strain L26-B" /LENGTH=143 /DNA_ID=CAMNT_0038989381 /DNA_START=67 /DNA_END=498 /DNA_ORIENTATION=+